MSAFEFDIGAELHRIGEALIDNAMRDPRVLPLVLATRDKEANGRLGAEAARQTVVLLDLITLKETTPEQIDEQSKASLEAVVQAFLTP